MKKKGKSSYSKIIKLIKDKKFDKIAAIASPKSAIEKATKGKVKIRNGIAQIGKSSIPLPNALSKRLIGMVKQKADTMALVNFWDRLKKNPSKASRHELFGFLDEHHVPITSDGHFLAYKGVRSNFMDCRSGTFNNSPGKTVQMPRKDVDPNRHNACSTGLHVAAFDYVSNWYSNNKWIIVKVDPKDVVSVPVDHDAGKMRVCKYEVLNEYKAKQEIKAEVQDRKKVIRKTFEVDATRGFIRLNKDMVALLPKSRKQISVVVNTNRSRFVLVTHNPRKKPHFIRKYKTKSSVSVTKDALVAAKIDGINTYVYKKTRDGIEIRPKK